MEIYSILFFAAASSFVLFLFYSISNNAPVSSSSWIVPALLSAAFFVYSGYTISVEGVLGFYVEHTRNFWGNQIWFDLLLAASVGWYVMLPQAKSMGMNLKFWAVLVVATGSIGFMAMLARFLWLQQNSSIRRK